MQTQTRAKNDSTCAVSTQTLRVECRINLCRNRSCRSLTCYLNTSQSSGSWNEGNSIFTYVRFIRTLTCSVTFERVRIPRLRHHRVWQIVRSCFIAPVVFHSPLRGYPAFPLTNQFSLCVREELLQILRPVILGVCKLTTVDNFSKRGTCSTKSSPKMPRSVQLICCEETCIFQGSI